MDETEKPRRRNRQSRRHPVVVSSDGMPVAPQTDEENEKLEASRDPNREAIAKSEQGSAELLRRLQLHHRHGFGEYNKSTDA